MNISNGGIFKYFQPRWYCLCVCVWCDTETLRCIMMTSSNRNIFRVTGHLCGEFTDPWRGPMMFSLICVWINGWVNNREAGDLRRHRGHYDVIVMMMMNNVVSTLLLLNNTHMWLLSRWVIGKQSRHISTQRAHGTIITSPLRQNDVIMMLSWRHMPAGIYCAGLFCTKPPQYVAEW